MRKRAELFAAIRRDARSQDLSIRALAEKYGVHRRTIRDALESIEPPERKKPPKRKRKLEPFTGAIDEILKADLEAPAKQRHTVRRLHERLMDEWGMSDVAYTTLAEYVSERRKELEQEARARAPEAFIRQSHRPGVGAEVDFGEIWVDLAGVRTKCFLFSFRLSFSGKAVHRISLSCGQEAFFEGHVHALKTIGGVPTGQVRYDNLRAAVHQVVGLSRSRIENDRWTAFRVHYGIDAFYCRPGLEGAHEKGGVEGDIGWFRRNHFVPVPVVADLDELNAAVERWDAEDETRRIGARAQTVGQYFEVEKMHLAPLPEEDFEVGRLFCPRVDRFSQVTVRQVKYSVPVRYIGRKVRVLLYASHLVVFEGRTEIARHRRLLRRGEEQLKLDHYLEALLIKPGALPGATALDQARAAGKFTPVHDRWWQLAGRAHGQAAGTRELIRILLLHRSLAHEHVVAGLAAAIGSGALTSDAVAVLARRAAQGLSDNDSPGETDTASPAWGERPCLPIDTRPPPSVAAYDWLLKRLPTPPSPHHEGESDHDQQTHDARDD
ncbi:IS21 family transposase [Glycomyces xiaoerkulensis]|uniref:IS21 family transposase n=1 Tax=Glycomyces xiaoerkulensis TaxID=2038139 RepID=UPI000C25A1B6|nr:IS21 family transposase [Glycomyces xiaoerkulensis]